MQRGGYVYIITNKYNTVLYTGVTSNLRQRIYDHIHKTYPNSFTKKYNVNKLVYFECFSSIEEAIMREEQIKGGSRRNKIILIERFNKEWNDLWNEIQDFD